MKPLHVEIHARNETIAQLIQNCAERKILFGELCEKIAKMGYKTTGLFEMVVEARKSLEKTSSNS